MMTSRVHSRILVYESMSIPDVAWACLCVMAGCRVRYVKKPRRAARVFLARVLRQRRFRVSMRPYRFSWQNDYFDGVWGDRALAVVDDVYGRLSAAVSLRGMLKRFPLAAELAFKKTLATQLARFFYLNELLSSLSQAFSSRVIFMPASGIFYGYYTSGPQEVIEYGFLTGLLRSSGITVRGHERVVFSGCARFRGLVCVCVEWAARHARMIAHIAAHVLRAVQNSVFPKPRGAWRYGVMIMSVDRQFQNDTEGLDFLVDGKSIVKDEIIFIPHPFVKLGRRELSHIARKNLACVGSLSAYVSFRSWARMLHSYLRCLFIVRPAFLKAACELCLGDALWRGLASRVTLGHVIGHHDVSVSALCRNIVLEEVHKTQSWLYIDANNFTVFFAPDDGRIRYKTNFYSFMYYTRVVCWNKKIEEILRESHNMIGRYSHPGCLWSSFIERWHSVLPGRNDPEARTLVVFDSSYTEYSLSDSRRAYFFYKGILRLLDDLHGVRVLMKPKKSRKYLLSVSQDRSMFRVLDRLEHHARYAAMDYTQPRGEIIAGADLVVAYPFTSPAFEAVCAGIPAVYFDATGAFSRSLYQGSGMVACGYPDLVRKVTMFLNMSRADFRNWQCAHRSVFDDFMDGRGLERFIRVLAGEHKPLYAGSAAETGTAAGARSV